MNYFQPYPSDVQEVDIVAWESEVAAAGREPALRQLIESRREQLFPSFLTTYRALRQLPRGARRELQRRFVRLVDECVPAGSNRATISNLARSLAGIAFLITLEHGVADAATINVTTNIPKIVADGRCSLAEAIINANNDAATHADCASGGGSDTIVMPAKSTHQVNTILGSYYGATGLPLITGAITIEGNGGRIARPANRTLFRLMAVTNSGDLTLKNLTLSGGFEYFGGAVFNAGKLTIQSATISGGHVLVGGAVYNAPTGTLTISDSTLSRHAAVEGGAVFNFQGSVKIQSSTISGNHAYDGGGVSSREGTLEIENSTITGNKADYRGGGIYGSSTYIDVKNSIVTKNTADAGGGVRTSSSTLSVDNSAITKNRATSSGGGMYIQSGMVTTISRSEISANLALSGAGVSVSNGHRMIIEGSKVSGNKARAQGGGLESWATFLSISNTTISKNSAGTFGGGVSVTGDILEVNNSTITGNSARTLGGGAWLEGRSDISNSTITGNTAVTGGGLFRNLGPYAMIGAHVVLERNLISGNRATTGSEIHNTRISPVAILSTEFSVIGVSNNAGISGFSLGATDIVPSGPIASILAPLADNGGPTPTHALVAGSPAIDAVPGVLPECSGTDQRGAGRPQGAGCDIGAFEK